MCFSLHKHKFFELLLPERRFYFQSSLILLNWLNKESYALHLSNLKDKSIFKITKIVTLSQFIPLILFERNLSTVALISLLKRQSERDLANQPVSGAALLFSFDNDDSSTAVLIVRQRIPIAGILNSRTIFLWRPTISGISQSSAREYLLRIFHLVDWNATNTLMLWDAFGI